MFSRPTAALPQALALAATTIAVSGMISIAPAGATTAQGAEAVSTGQKLFYTAASGQTNHLKIDWALGPTDPDSQLTDYIYTFDDTVTITPGAGCIRPDVKDDTKVVCTVTEPNTSASDLDTLIVDLGDRDDTATVDPDNSGYSRIHGGSGADTLTGHGDDVLYGDAGNDHLSGGGGAYSEGAFGGAGDDTLTDCGHTCHGGPGNDTLTGGLSEFDEEYTDYGNALYGDDGDDVIHGNEGDDTLTGGRGDDRLYGGPGADTIYGNTGDDILHGGPGTDRLSGGAGVNHVYQD
ncbi:calcium-binding protein [Streptomyces sp. LP11]|uniref:Calcium-binding protein n=1 Tax=Streptomyces pyxinicus TaxID=2970331 RepID=A0ABT2B7D1_9ACTN|nr:calcium-binding protein [Streptomyces sp. LP11]MCS0604423.1 calcium-binding protein [Streptomyces sp. LP11]